MVRIKYLQCIAVFFLASQLTGCSSGPEPREEKKEPVDIYAQLKNDQVQFATEETTIEKGSPEYVLNNMKEARAAYFQKKFDHAKKLCKRVLSLVPSTAEAYYWLARMAVDEGDFQQAYTMSSKGIGYAKEPNMKTELQRIQTMTQMGAR